MRCYFLTYWTGLVYGKSKSPRRRWSGLSAPGLSLTPCSVTWLRNSEDHWQRCTCAPWCTHLARGHFSPVNMYQLHLKSPPSCSKATLCLISHASKVMLKILQGRLQQYMNRELPDVQAGFRKGRGTRDQIANIRWIIEKAREFQKNIYFCFIDYAKVFDCVDHNKLENSERDVNTRPPDLPLEKSVFRSGSNS